MNTSSPNPYSPPQDVEIERPRKWNVLQLIPLVIWPWIAVTPAIISVDRLSTMIYLAYGLVLFWTGILLASSYGLVTRLLVLLLCTSPAILILTMEPNDRFRVVFGIYCLLCIGMGCWSYWAIRSRRDLVLLYYFAGYICGMVVGPAATIIGSYVGACLAIRTISRSQS